MCGTRTHIHVALKQNQLHEAEAGPDGIKPFFFMLNSLEHEILNAHKYKNIKKIGFC